MSFFPLIWLSENLLIDNVFLPQEQNCFMHANFFAKDTFLFTSISLPEDLSIAQVLPSQEQGYYMLEKPLNNIRSPLPIWFLVIHGQSILRKRKCWHILNKFFPVIRKRRKIEKRVSEALLFLILVTPSMWTMKEDIHTPFFVRCVA